MSIIKGTNQIVAGFGGTKRSIGEVYFSQSSLATDNSGALPLFTGETIASANTIYPDFYNWVLAHTELQCTSAEYESALSAYGECPKYVVIASTPTRYKWENLLTGTLYTLSRNPAVGDLAYDVTGNNSWPITEASSTEIVVPTFVDNKPLSYVEEVAGTSASLRLPKLSNYIKAANTAEGITQKEAGLPNIDSDTNWVNVTSGTESAATNINVLSNKGAFGGTNSQGGHGIAGNNYPINWRRFDASLSNPIYGNSDTVTPASTTLYPWVVAYAAAVPASTAQAAEFQKGLSGKADTNLGNIPSNYDYVVERYSDASGNWYRKYKSGWIEQGGLVTVSGFVGATVTLLKPFANTAYNIQLTLQTTNAVTYLANAAQSVSIANSKTTTSFGVQTAGIQNYEINGISWRAEGKFGVGPDPKPSVLHKYAWRAADDTLVYADVKELAIANDTVAYLSPYTNDTFSGTHSNIARINKDVYRLFYGDKTQDVVYSHEVTE